MPRCLVPILLAVVALVGCGNSSKDGSPPAEKSGSPSAQDTALISRLARYAEEWNETTHAYSVALADGTPASFARDSRKLTPQLSRIADHMSFDPVRINDPKWRRVLLRVGAAIRREFAQINNVTDAALNGNVKELRREHRKLRELGEATSRLAIKAAQEMRDLE